MSRMTLSTFVSSMRDSDLSKEDPNFRDFATRLWPHLARPGAFIEEELAVTLKDDIMSICDGVNPDEDEMTSEEMDAKITIGVLQVATFINTLP
jgi:hypothetical protein